MNSNTINQAYSAFCQHAKKQMCFESVDYLGVNITNATGNAPVFKAYYAPQCSDCRGDKLYDYLENEDMLRYYSSVYQGFDNYVVRRFDFGLKNRTNVKMGELRSWLRSNYSFISRYENQIDYLARTKLSNCDGYDYSSLYFLGHTASRRKGDTLKMHFLTRMCDNPEVTYKNYQYNDSFYLDYYDNSHIPQLRKLVVLCRNAIDNCGGHLWMCGMDFSASSAAKFKLYVNRPTSQFSGLLQTLNGDMIGENLIEPIQTVQSWRSEQADLDDAGFALCLDETEKMSINMYFVYRQT